MKSIYEHFVLLKFVKLKRIKGNICSYQMYEPCMKVNLYSLRYLNLCNIVCGLNDVLYLRDKYILLKHLKEPWTKCL